MLRKISATAAIALALSMYIAGPASGAPRTEELPYEMPAQGAYTPIVWAWAFDCFEARGCVVIQVNNKERFLSLEIEDATGLPVYAQLRDPYRDGPIAHIYGQTEKPIRVYPSLLALHILPGLSPSLEPSAPTTGVVHATYSSRR